MRSRVFVAATAAAMLALVVGCSSDAEPSGPDASASSTEPSTEEPSATDTSTGPAPATGQRVEASVLDFRLPESARWSLTRGGLSARYFDNDGGIWAVAVIELGDTPGLDRLARVAEDVQPDLVPKARRLADRTVNGVEGYVLESDGRDRLYYEFGTVYEGQGFSLIFDFPPSPRARDWIDSVLASVEWK